jgi:hypothetical protein
MTKKQATIARLNELRIKAGMPEYDPKKVTMSVAECETLIHRLENPSDPAEKPTPPTTADLLRKRNVIASHLDLPRLKVWKGSRDKLEKQIQDFEAKTSHITIKHIPAAVASGIKTRRAIDTTKMQGAIKKLDKKQERAKIKEMKATAKKIATSFGFTTSLVVAYLEVKNTTRPPLAGDALRSDINAFAQQRAKALKHDKKASPGAQKRPPGGKRNVPGMLYPGDLAALLDRPARAVRIKLRALEKQIPKAWRGEGRWAFLEKHKADVLKLLKGEKK